MLILLACLSFVAIGISLGAWVLHFLRRLKPVSRAEKNSMWSLVFKLFSIIVFVVLAGIILVFNLYGIKKNEQKSMDDSLNKTSMLLALSIRNLSQVTFSEWMLAKATNDAICRNLFFKSTRNLMQTSKYNFRYFETVLEEAPKMVENVEKFLADLKRSSVCPLNTDGLDDLKNEIEELRTLSYTLSEPVKKFDETIYSMKDEMENDAKIQLELDSGEDEMRAYLNTMIDLISHFQNETHRFENMKEEWKIRVSPTFGIRNITVFIVNSTLGILTVLYIFVILDLFISFNKHIGQRFWVKGVMIPFIATIFLTVFASSIIAAMSFGLLGKFECSLNSENFGVSNFVSPYNLMNATVAENSTITVCSTPNTTFFSALGTGPLITNQSVAKSMEMEFYKEKYLSTMTQPNRLKEIDLSKFSLGIEKSKKIFEQFEKVYELRCFTRDQIKELLKFKSFFYSFLSHFKGTTDATEQGNKNLKNLRNVITPHIDAEVEAFLEYFIKKIKPTQTKIANADFECNPIIEEFSKISDDICQELDIPLEYCWLYLFVTILSCLICLFIHILIYRCELGVTKDKISEIMHSANSSSSTSLLKKTINKSDGSIVTTAA